MCDGELHPGDWDQSTAWGCHVLHFVFLCKDLGRLLDMLIVALNQHLAFQDFIACLSAVKVMAELLACEAFLEHIHRSVSYELMCWDEIPKAGSWEG